MATPTGEIRIGDKDTKFHFVFLDDNASPVNLTTATLIEAIFTKPDDDETTVVKDITGVFGTDGTDGDAYYATENPDPENSGAPFLDVAGIWQRQGYIESPTWSGHSTIVEFEVFENLR